MLRLIVLLLALAGLSGYLFVRPVPLSKGTRQPLLGSTVLQPLPSVRHPTLSTAPERQSVTHPAGHGLVGGDEGSARGVARPRAVRPSVHGRSVLSPPRGKYRPSPARRPVVPARGAVPHPLVARMLRSDPGSTANPPRRPARLIRPRAPAPPTLLRLPKVLPARILNVPIMMYHHVSSQPVADIGQYGLTVTDQDFAAQLAYLRRDGYHTILLRQVFAALYHNAPLPSRPIVLTFDDGYLDNYTDALPLLLRYHDVGEFNIISAYPGITLGVNSYMTWQQIKKLVADGMEIGSHTVDHQDLGILPEDHLRFELRDSRNILQQKLRVPVQVICYPSGEPFKDESAAAQQLVLSLVPQYGYVLGLEDGPLVTSMQNAQQPYQLNRIRVAGGESLQGFMVSLP